MCAPHRILRRQQTSTRSFDNNGNLITDALYIYSLLYTNAIIQRDKDTNDNGTLDQTLHFTRDANFNVTSVVATNGDQLQHQVYSNYGEIDIEELAFNKPAFTNAVSGLGSCANTVTVAGHCYPTEEVNYFIWGVLLRVAQDTLLNHNDPTNNGRLLSLSDVGINPDTYYLNTGESLVEQYRTAYALSVGVGVRAPLGTDFWGSGRNIPGRTAWTEAGYYNDFSKAAVNISGTHCPPSTEKNAVVLHWHIGDGSTAASGGGALVLNGAAP